MNAKILSHKIPAGFVRPAFALKKFKRLSRAVLSKWYVDCPILERPIDTRPDPGHKRSRVISLSDLEFVMSHFVEKFNDAIIDERREKWLWTQYLHRIYGWSSATIEKWRNGCPALNGQPLVIKTFHEWGNSARRHYVPEKLVLRIYDFQEEPIDRADYCDLTEAEEMGLPAEFLSRHSDTESPSQKVVPIGHPVLKDNQGKPRLIRTRRRRIKQKYTRRSNGRTGSHTRVAWQVLWSKKDLKDIRGAGAHELWLTRPEALKAGPFTESQLDHAEKQGFIRVQTFPLPPAAGQRVEAKHYHKLDIIKEATRRGSSLSMARPGDPSRAYKHTDGDTYWPSGETLAKLPGVNFGALHEYRISCKYLDGKPFRAVEVERDLWRSKSKKPWHFHEGDRDRIYRKMNGLPEPTAAPVNDNNVVIGKIDLLHGKVDKVSGKVDAVHARIALPALPSGAERIESKPKMGGRPKNISPGGEYGKFSYRFASEYHKALKDGVSRKIFVASAKDLNGTLLGDRGVSRILAWVTRNPQK
jgi:hypothetical protein